MDGTLTADGSIGRANRLTAIWRGDSGVLLGLLLVAIFNHWGYPLLIMTSIPVGIAGGIVGLWLLNAVGGLLPLAGFTAVVQPFDMTQPAVSRHLKVLESAGLITRRIEGSKRPCRIAPDGIAELDAWLTQLKSALTRNYERLDQVLAELTTEEE